LSISKPKYHCFSVLVLLNHFISSAQTAAITNQMAKSFVKKSSLTWSF
jgi:hypothetical protein